MSDLVTRDARSKRGQGLDFWAAELLKRGLISEAVFDEFVEKNNSKEERLREAGLPQLQHYGYFASVAEIRCRLALLIGERFIIREITKYKIRKMPRVGIDHSGPVWSKKLLRFVLEKM